MTHVLLNPEGKPVKVGDALTDFRGDIAYARSWDKGPVPGKLDTEISRACGVGPVCAKKLGFKRATLADAGKILEAMEAAASSIGELGPRWLPKSQACGRFI